VLTPVRTAGFTLVELLMGMALLAVLLLLGVPAMATYLQNSKLASATSGLFAGLQTARTEAIRRNVRTEFVFTNDPPSIADVANNLNVAANGVNWVVRAASGPAAWQPAIDAKSALEGEGNATAPAVVVTGAAIAPAVWTGIIPFNGFGGTANGAAYQIDITNPNGGLCVTGGGPMRCRRILVSPGGQINACDPAAVAGDSRAC
jgi:type IV fimbrial biogenesis protein FimT